MSELKRVISGLISEEVDRKNSTISGVITEYNPDNRQCTVEFTNPAGAGRIKLYNRALPEMLPGIITAQIKVGWEVILNAPLGDINYAEIISIRAPGGIHNPAFLGDRERTERTGKTTPLSWRL